MNAAILQEIAEYCRKTGLAESTFGRRAVNDGKLASRLRNGGRITVDTLERIRAFMAADNGQHGRSRPLVIERGRVPSTPPVAPPRPLAAPAQRTDDPQRNFRFFDN